MANVRQRNEVEAVIRQVASQFNFLIGSLPVYASWLKGLAPAYLSNGFSSVALIGGGSAFTNSSFALPLPAVAPGGSVPAVVTFTNTAGVLSAPVLSVTGSGYGVTLPTFSAGGTPGVFIPLDPTGSGASVSLTMANTDVPYNYTPSQVQMLQWFLANDYNTLGAMLQGSQMMTTATGVSVNSSGTGFLVGDVVTSAQVGCVGMLLRVTAVGGGGTVSGLQIVNGGIGAQVATGITALFGSGTGLTFNVTSTTLYNFTTQTYNWTGWGF